MSNIAIKAEKPLSNSPLREENRQCQNKTYNNYVDSN